ncbi:MAG: M20/M25/M40 family metallo-hydrolase [Selenomonadaceae bacterium]|nr:M20/M25/M40 family metallo-hydrolase [Selenomonadaceae bacterium]
MIDKIPDFSTEMESLTKSLVRIRSVNGTAGEREVAEFILRWLRSFPYFTVYPERAFAQEIPGDALGRENVFAYVHGTKAAKDGTSRKAIVWHGHIDTVGTEDFGALEPWAHDPDALLEKLLASDLPDAVRNDLATGDWMPGRGACDMKSGDAVFLVLLKYLSEHTDAFSGTVVLSLNCVEENEHTGILHGLDVLDELKEREGLDYLFAINNDYICPLYDGDPVRHLYAGAVGKLLPCVYIHGCETHVGQCFEGFDASVAAAEVVRRLNYNTELCDGYRGAYTLPPSVLKLADLKTSYNVQTAQEAWAYFNYFVHAASVTDILEKLQAIVADAMRTVAMRIDDEAAHYAELAHQSLTKSNFQPEILSYEELVAAVREKRAELDDELAAMARKLRAEGRDLREISLTLVRHLVRELHPARPLAVVFFSAPYCPANTLRQDVSEEQALYVKIEQLAQAIGEATGEQFDLQPFFPSLSDSSYLKIDDTPASVAALYRNLPGGKTISPVPTERIRSLSIPAIDFGCYGKDAHKWTERMYKPYTFHVLPQLILKAVAEFLGK